MTLATSKGAAVAGLPERASAVHVPDRTNGRTRERAPGEDDEPLLISKLDERAKREEELADAPSLVTARHISAVIAQPTTVRWLLRDVLERGVIAVLAGHRGTFKSFVALHWSLSVAHAGGDVLVVSAEGAGLDRRVLAWGNRWGIDVARLPLYVIERRIDFNSAEGIQAVLDAIQDLGIHPVLIVIDTLSKNSGALDENSNTEVKAFIGGLDVRIRRPLDATVLLIAHTGHSAQTRARGASALEADTDAAYVATRNGPDPMVSITRERFKDSPELPPLDYDARLTDLGYSDDVGQPVQSLVMVASDAPAAATVRAAQPRGKAQRQLLRALRANVPASGIWTLAEMREIGRKAGINRNTARDAAEALSLSPHMVGTIGGWRLAE